MVSENQEYVVSEIPIRAGVGLKPQHYEEIISEQPNIGWFEIHAENYMGDGGLPHHNLRKIREQYPISLHGVGLSIGAAQPLDKIHLERLKSVKERYQPGLFSEHLAWSTHRTDYYPDLLPVAYNQQSLTQVCDHVDQVQEVMGCRMLLENPSTYLGFETSTMSEAEFLTSIVERTGCGMLLDVNNVFISANNQSYDPYEYIGGLPLDSVGEIHLAGHATDQDDDGNRLLIDTHDREVSDPVWLLYEYALSKSGPVPTLIEWDSNVPDWNRLFAEAKSAEAILKKMVSMKPSEQVYDFVS